MQREPGPLRNGNPRGDPNSAPRCGARTRAGCSCRAPAMDNGRCRMHGGRSTGPRTPDGLARLAAARTTHGMYGAESHAVRAIVGELARRSNELIGLLHQRRTRAWRPPTDLRPFFAPITRPPRPRKSSGFK